MIIDCDACTMQHTNACDDCIVTALLGTDGGTVELDAAESSALGHLADAGLVSPLRLVTNPESPEIAAG